MKALWDSQLGRPRLPNLLLLLTLTAVSCHVCFVVCVCELIFHRVAFARDPIMAWMAEVFAIAELWIPEHFALVSQLRLFHTALFPSALDEHGACLFLSVTLLLTNAQHTHSSSGPPQWIVFLDLLREKTALS